MKNEQKCFEEYLWFAGNYSLLFNSVDIICRFSRKIKFLLIKLKKFDETGGGGGKKKINKLHYFVDYY